MATVHLSLFTCSDCGKVCRSVRGLTQHKSTHSSLPQLGDPSQDVHRDYHPLLNGKLSVYLLLPLLTTFQKGHPAITTEVFSHQGHHPHHHHQSRTMTGLHLHREQDSNLPTFCTSRPTFPRPSSTNSLTSGALPSSLIAIFPPSPTIKSSMPRSMRSD